MISIMGVDSCSFMESDNLKGAIHMEGTCHVFWPGKATFGIPTVNMRLKRIAVRDGLTGEEIGIS